MKKSLFFILFVFISFSVYSQTWTEAESSFLGSFQYECTIITKAQWDQLFEQYKEDNDNCDLKFLNTLEIGNVRKVVSGTRPELTGYYYIFEKGMTVFGWFPILAYGNSNTGRMEIWFSGGGGGLRIGSNEYTTQYNQYLRRVQNTPQQQQQRTATTLVEQGLQKYEKRDYDGAIADYTEAIRIDPNGANAYYNRGIVYFDKNDYDRAVADYTQAIRINSNYADAYNNRGIAYANKYDYDRSIADYTQAIRLNPNYANAYINRGISYYYKNDYDRAIADYTQAIRINPNYANAYYYRGIAYDDKNDYNRAIEDYEAVLRIEPNHANAKTFLEMVRRARER